MEDEPHLFCIKMGAWNPWLIFVVGAFGIFSTFLLHGYSHETLYKTYQFKETVFLTFAQLLGYASLSFPAARHIFTGKIPMKAPMKLYIITGVSLGLSMALANYAALHLSYATEVLFKSSKLIPVMIGNIIFLKKKPKLTEVISVLLIVIGLIGISLGDLRGKNKFSVSGIIAVISSLCIDAFASNMEDKIMSVYGASQDETIFVLYGFASILFGSISIINGEMKDGIARCIENPVSVVYILIFSLLGALGIQFVYLIMKVFGSLFTVTVTSVRKALTVVTSFIMFPDKHFTIFHAASIIMLSIGTSINIYNKTRSKKDQVQSLENDVDLFKDQSLSPVSLEPFNAHIELEKRRKDQYNKL